MTREPQLDSEDQQESQWCFLPSLPWQRLASPAPSSLSTTRQFSATQELIFVKTVRLMTLPAISKKLKGRKQSRWQNHLQLGSSLSFSKQAQELCLNSQLMGNLLIFTDTKLPAKKSSQHRGTFWGSTYPKFTTTINVTHPGSGAAQSSVMKNCEHV